jgi:3-deoxy-D-manno-octulosonate 8-phosphate phosphatase (KDO 8-P phosphatase)
MKNKLDIKLLAMDVDGVLTDGVIVVHPDGSESKNFHVHDGAWIRIWKRMGLKTAIITGRECAAVQCRAQDLEIDYIYQKAWEKKEVLEQLVEASGVQAEQIAYIGDDVFDLPVIQRVGFSASVADANPEIRQTVDYVTQVAGGRGAVAELIRYLLRKLGLWEQAMEKYRK